MEGTTPSCGGPASEVEERKRQAAERKEAGIVYYMQSVTNSAGSGDITGNRGPGMYRTRKRGAGDMVDAPQAASQDSQETLMHQQRPHMVMLQSSPDTADSMANNRNNMDSTCDIREAFSSEENSQDGEAGGQNPSEGRSEVGFTEGIIHSFEDDGSISDDSVCGVDPELLLGA